MDATGGEVMGALVDEVLQVYRLADSGIQLAVAALGVGGGLHLGHRPPQPRRRRFLRGADVPAGGASGPDASVVIGSTSAAVLVS